MVRRESISHPRVPDNSRETMKTNAIKFDRRKQRVSVKCSVCPKEYSLVPHRVKSNLDKNDGVIICRNCNFSLKVGKNPLYDRNAVYTTMEQLANIPISSKFKIKVSCNQCSEVFSLTTSNAITNHKTNDGIVCHGCVSGTEKVRQKQSATRLKISIDDWNGFVSSRQFYSAEWTSKLRKEIRARDRVCFICKNVNNAKRLSVHHIDWNKFNCDKTNLVALCNSCHCSIHGKGIKTLNELMIYAAPHWKLAEMEDKKLPVITQRQNAYGAEVSPFFAMGGTPTATDAGYNRDTFQVKYLGTQGSVQHNLTLIQSAHG